MQKVIGTYRHLIGPFQISDGFEVVDILFEQNYLSVSCLEKKGEWYVEILSANRIYDATIRNLLRGYSYDVLKSDELPETNWLEKCFENFNPITVGNFYLFGPHLRGRPTPRDKIAIEIAAATAFGSGEHPTTNRCLLACQTFFDHKKHKTVLDIGSGSGVLSIALAKLGARDVVACDNDPEAVRVSRENADINNVANKMCVFQNEDCEFATKKYDFIVSNILAEPLVLMADEISHSLNRNGILVLSGFYSTDISVAKKYTNTGLSIIHRYDLHEWSAIVFEKRICDCYNAPLMKK